MMRRLCHPGALLVFTVSLVLADIVAAQPKPESPMTQERLAARVEAFWKAWQARDLYRVFLIYAPSYRKETSELAFYELTRGMLGITPIEYRLGAVELSEGGSRASVTVDAQTVIPPLGRIRNKLVQTWVYEDGDWYRLMDPPSVPPMPPNAVNPVDQPVQRGPEQEPASPERAPRP